MAHPELISLFGRTVQYGSVVWVALVVQGLGIVAGLTYAIWLSVAGSGTEPLLGFMIVAGGGIVPANAILLHVALRLKRERLRALETHIEN